MNDPIRVDWLPTALWPGRLGLTFAPGKQGASQIQPGVTHRRDMQEDLRALAQAGTQILSPLIEAHEFGLLGMDDYQAQAEAQHLTLAPCPMPDLGVPPDRAAFAAYVDEIMDALLDGQHVVVHCRGGLGRAGLVAACLLVQAGMNAENAIVLVRQTRSPHAIQTPEQEQFIREFERGGPSTS